MNTRACRRATSAATAHAIPLDVGRYLREAISARAMTMMADTPTGRRRVSTAAMTQRAIQTGFAEMLFFAVRDFSASSPSPEMVREEKGAPGTRLHEALLRLRASVVMPDD